MKMTKKFVDSVRLARNRVLESDDPYLFLEADNECLLYVMNDVQAFIEVSFEFSVNPLGHLRHYFPAFEWLFVIPTSVHGVGTTVSGADYVWPEHASDDWSGGMVVAREINRKARRRICWYRSNWNYWGEKYAKECGARFLIQDDQAVEYRLE